MAGNTQVIMIKKHLEAGMCISGLEALSLYGIYRLSDVIWKLKKEPYCLNIDKEMREDLGSGKKYASYFLVRV